MNMSKKVEILISCHKPTDIVLTSVFKPIQVGAKDKPLLMDGFYRDDEGDNISLMNPMYCELTAQYWAWKNLELDYYGFCHYRRYFNFSDNRYEEDDYGNIIEKYLDKQAIEKYALDDATVSNLVDEYDVIVTERKDLQKLPSQISSSREHYKMAKRLHMRDYELLLSIIDELYPDYSSAAHKFADGHISCFCNMYILRKDLFFKYCEWMFSVLKVFCDRRNMKYYSTEALRTPGHLSERLFNIFLIHLEETVPDLRVKELQCVLFENTDPQEPQLIPAFDGGGIPVVFAANNRFVPVFAACLKSLINHASAENKYDIVLIESDITKDNKNALLRMVNAYNNISLRFYDPGRLLKNYKLKANAHITVETYYRFLIQEILVGYDKVLYLDCDTIINADVAELYGTDVTGYMLAATHDADFLGQINGANPETRRYCRESFHMHNPYDYFQAGVILFNEKEMKAAYSTDEWLRFASTPYKYNDQDVLNLYCEGSVKFIDMEWNLITDCDHYRVENVISFAPDSIQKEYARAHKNPKIIHYAGHMKPWYRPSEDYAFLFWNTLKGTEFYEEMLFRMAEGIDYWANYERTKEATHLRVLNNLMPLGSKRRAVLDDVYAHVMKK